MGRVFARYRVGITALILILGSFQMMSISIANPSIAQVGHRGIATFVSPLSRLFHEVDQSGRNFLNHYIYLQGVEAQLGELQGKLKELEKQNSMLIELAHENERLRQLLSFTTDSELTGIAAQVIGRSPSNWYRTVTIDRGTDDGIQIGWAVVDGHAVVGQTIAVSASSSLVLLLTDNTSAIDAVMQTSRAVGIAEGALGPVLHLRYVVKDQVVQIGDRVLASGLDGIFPKGTLIGVVTDADTGERGMFQRIEVKPSVDANRLETVLVIRPSKSRDDNSSPNTRNIPLTR